MTLRSAVRAHPGADLKLRSVDRQTVFITQF